MLELEDAFDCRQAYLCGAELLCPYVGHAKMVIGVANRAEGHRMIDLWEIKRVKEQQGPQMHRIHCEEQISFLKVTCPVTWGKQVGSQTMTLFIKVQKLLFSFQTNVSKNGSNCPVWKNRPIHRQHSTNLGAQ